MNLADYIQTKVNLPLHQFFGTEDRDLISDFVEVKLVNKEAKYDAYKNIIRLDWDKSDIKAEVHFRPDFDMFRHAPKRPLEEVRKSMNKCLIYETDETYQRLLMECFMAIEDKLEGMMHDGKSCNSST